MGFRESARATGIKALCVQGVLIVPEVHVSIDTYFINPLNINTMSVKEVATRDIQEDLSRQGKCFLAFHSELDEVMDELVNNQIKAQELCQSSK